MRRVVFNQKGGVGKSTIVCNLAAIAAASGRRTLVVDLDSQANTTQYLLGDRADQTPAGVADFFGQLLSYRLFRDDIEDFLHPTPFANLQLFAASPQLFAASPQLDELEGKLESRYKMFKLREALESLHQFDQVYIDTPPALNFYTRSALIAAHRCLVPFDCDDFSRRALYTLLANVDEIRDDHNRDLTVEGVVVNQFQSRARLPKRLVDEPIGEGLPVLDTFLSATVKIRESHQRSLPMVHLDARHKLTLEYRALYDRLQTQGSEIESA